MYVHFVSLSSYLDSLTHIHETVQSTFNAVLYGWTPEAFPAAVRGSACGLASFWGRLASVVAPLVAARLGSSTGVLYLAGGGVFVSTLCALGLRETKGGEAM